MTGLRVALTFLTRLPAGRTGPLTPDAFARAAPWFVVVGLLVGAVLGGVRMLAETALDPGAATVLALLAATLVTGGLHEDGLADTADAVGAHTERRRRLEILRDPRLGSYGVMALIGAFLLAWTLLSSLDAVQCLRAAIVGHVLARWSILPQSQLLAPARADGAAARLRARTTGTLVASAFAVALTLGVAGVIAGVVVLVCGVAVTAVAAAVIRHVFGGVTGDTYGAVAKLVELMAYMVLAALWA